MRAFDGVMRRIPTVPLTEKEREAVLWRLAQIQGTGGAVLAVETNSGAARFTPRPLDVGALGSYSIGMTSGTIAAGQAANGTVFSARWSDATRLMLLRRVAVSMGSLVTGFTAGIGVLDIMFARSFTASDSGGTATVLSGNNAKRKGAFGTSLMGDMRIASTANLTVGTRTLDSQSMANTQFTVTAAAQTVHLPPFPLWNPDFAGEWPMVYVQNEGFIVRHTVPATGTWQFQCNVEWSEVTAFQ